MDLCWPLLMDICSVYGGSLGGAMPIILTASSGLGPQLGQLVISTVGVPQGASEQQLHAAWAAVHCLPHAVPTQEQATESLQGVLNATRAGSSSSKGSASMAAFVLHCSARVALAKLAAPDLSSLEEALTFLEQQPREYHAVHAAAELLAHSQTAALPATLAPSHFARLAGLLAPNLGSKSAALRRQTLRLLCAFPQPSSQASGGTEDVDAGQACDALQQLLGIEERPLGADSGRAAVVALGRLKNYFEYGRIPDVLVPAVVSGLLGTLHIRFSSLWSPAASSLAAALDAHPAVTWPLLLEALTAAQAAFLRGEVQVQSHSLPGAVEDEEHKEVTLRERFAATVAEGSAEASGGSTDAAVRLTHLLKALSGANNNVVEGKAKDWIPLFLTYSAAKTPEGVGGTEEAEEVEDDAGGGEEESENEEEIVATPEHAVSSVPTRIWRSGLKEWLALMAGLKGLRAVPNADAVRHSVATHLMDSDPAVQQAVLKCLKAFKMSWLAPYVDRLLRLADNKTLRAELAAFPLALKPTSLREGDEEIQPEHRQALLPVVMALLFPKMRKRSGRLGGKGEKHCAVVQQSNCFLPSVAYACMGFVYF